MNKKINEEFEKMRLKNFLVHNKKSWVSFLKRIKNRMEYHIKRSEWAGVQFCPIGLCNGMIDVMDDEVFYLCSNTSHTLTDYIISIVEPTRNELKMYCRDKIYWGRTLDGTDDDDSVSRVMLWQVMIEYLGDVIDYYEREEQK
jgi:hypothetical protein